MKVVTLSGTRPDWIRLIPTIKKLDELKTIQHTVIWLGQNYDDSLSEQFFNEFNRFPDVLNNMDTKYNGEVYISYMISRLTGQLENIRPDCVLTLGDTHATFVAVYVAKRLGIPVFHMEAGNRCYDSVRVPEELNRRMIDSISDWHLCYTQRSREHLLREGHNPDKVIVTGNPIFEAMMGIVMVDDKEKDFYLSTIHRKENLSRLGAIFKQFSKLEKKIFLSGHPSLLDAAMKCGVDVPNNVYIVRPWNFSEFLTLENNAECIITDSGTVPEEASILGVPSVLIRYSTERPELLEQGNMVVCSNLKDLETCIDIAKKTGTKANMPKEYEYNVSDNVIKMLMRYNDE